MFKIIFLLLSPFLKRKDSFTLQKQIKYLPECSFYLNVQLLQQCVLSEKKKSSVKVVL